MLITRKQIAEAGGRPPAGALPGFDSETAANIIRGPGVPRPPDSDPGHFHDGHSAEFFFVLEGHLSLLTEGVPLYRRRHAGRRGVCPGRGLAALGVLAGDAMSGRISIHGIASSLNLLDPEHSAAAARSVRKSSSRAAREQVASLNQFERRTP